MQNLQFRIYDIIMDFLNKKKIYESEHISAKNVNELTITRRNILCIHQILKNIFYFVSNKQLNQIYDNYNNVEVNPIVIINSYNV